MARQETSYDKTKTKNKQTGGRNTKRRKYSSVRKMNCIFTDY
jgi:hypothetical protein